MTKFAIEVSYILPVCRLRHYEAASLAEACQMALKDDDWENATKAYDASTTPLITGIWHAGEEYLVSTLPLPPPSKAC